MLSVQIANTGMERLGVPTRTSLNSPTDDRGHISRRMRIVNRDITVRDASCGLSDRQTRNNNNNQHHGGCSFLSNSLNCNCKNNYNSDNSNQSSTKLKSSSSTSSTGSSSSNASSTSSTSSKAAVTRICPHHVTLPDSEYRYDRDLQIRAPYQQSEITRSCIKPPPNKCVSDVPKSYQFEQSNYSGISCNLGSSVYQQNNHFSNNQQPIIIQQPKSKQSVITKLFSRKSTNSGPASYSPKSPSPSLSSGSASSSSSSLCSAQTLPLAATITSTNCSLGRKQQQNSNEIITNTNNQINDQHSVVGCSIIPSLTTTSSSSLSALTSTTSLTLTASSSSSVAAVTTTAATAAVATEDNCKQQQFQQYLVGSTNSNSLSSTLHLLKSSSCNLSSSSMASLLEDNVAASSLSLPYSAPSIDCCYSQATNFPSSSSLARNSNDKENNHRI